MHYSDRSRHTPPQLPAALAPSTSSRCTRAQETITSHGPHLSSPICLATDTPKSPNPSRPSGPASSSPTSPSAKPSPSPSAWWTATSRLSPASQLIDFFKQTQRPYLVVATKSDRLSHNALAKSLATFKREHESKRPPRLHQIRSRFQSPLAPPSRPRRVAIS